MNFRVRPMANHDLARDPHARMDEAGLAVAMRGLVEVHEIHVDGVPRQFAIELRVQMNASASSAH